MCKGGNPNNVMVGNLRVGDLGELLLYGQVRLHPPLISLAKLAPYQIRYNANRMPSAGAPGVAGAGKANRLACSFYEFALCGVSYCATA